MICCTGYVASTYATLLGPTLRRYPGAATLDATSLRQVRTAQKLREPTPESSQYTYV